MATVNFSEGPKVAEGTYKEVVSAVPSSGDSVYSMRLGKTFERDFMVVHFKPGAAPEDVFGELELYYDFGQKEISPKILYVKIPGVKEPVSLRMYLTKYKNVIPESYFVEKGNCDKGILDYYKGNYMLLFRNLRTFLQEKVVGNNLVNADIKIPNLCIDKEGNFKMIDLDPNFLQPIQLDGIIDEEDYINYMMFQVYVHSYTYKGVVINDSDLNIIFPDGVLPKMIRNISTFKVDNTYTHPLTNLLWYSNLKMNSKPPDELYNLIWAVIHAPPNRSPYPRGSSVLDKGIFGKLVHKLLRNLYNIVKKGGKKSKRRVRKTKRQNRLNSKKRRTRF